MIKVTLTYKDDMIDTFEVSGHSNYAVKGSDIVCAGVSGIVVGVLNALSELTNVKLDVKVDDGYVYLKCDKDNEFQKILKVILIQLKSVEESYSKYIKIKSNHL